jgi:long-chain acyl-CoA synthetase
MLSWFAAKLLTLVDRLVFTLLYILKGKKALPYDSCGDPNEIQAVQVENKNGDTDSSIETGPYRNVATAKGELYTTPDKSVTTLNELFDYVTTKYSKKRCMGSRRLLKIEKVTVDKKEFDVPEYHPELTWYTYEQVAKRVRDISAGIVEFTKINSGDKLAIYENTCEEWQLTAHSCFKYGIQIVTVYASLGTEALIHSLNEAEVTVIMTGEDLLANFAKQVIKQVPTIKYIIYNETKRPSGQTKPKLPEFPENVKLISLTEIEKLGQSLKEAPAIRRSPKTDDLAFIMYTSGTTGTPKGVMIKHFNVLAAAVGIGSAARLDQSDQTYMAYLPLAHILEFVAETFMLTIGASLGFGTARTLSDKGARPYGDLRAVKPTLLAGVPRVFDTLRKAVEEIVSDTRKTSNVNRFIFRTAYAAKLDAVRNRRDTPLFNFLVFNKLKQQLGGRVKVVLSGGAPLNAETQEFMRVCFDTSVVQGYGLTETCAALCLQPTTGPFRVRCAGPLVLCSELKLVSVPEMGYLHTDNPPRGEICTRGPCISAGYYKQEEKTKEEFRDNGWFHTGDIGTINQDGSISVVDRKKNLVKLDHGEYVALEKLEVVFANSSYISPNGVCVYGDSDRSYVVANILPQMSILKRYANDNGITFNSNEELVSNPKIVKLVLDDLHNEAKKASLQRFEYLGDIRLHTDEWTPENGLLTAAMKLQRNEVNKKYKQQIDAMYKK